MQQGRNVCGIDDENRLSSTQEFHAIPVTPDTYNVYGVSLDLSEVPPTLLQSCMIP